ncbi:hypothetical protein GWK47_044089 [Chionoecetes opilio]|uniref:Uncharacterized protein n=1 Tax=Chionoecetes opilio TaxID=41210 RepID=A0A8J4YED3_CHIOP|nr:hypothetical protein GWK47_044089 [Chionoecetes opilio]
MSTSRHPPPHTFRQPAGKVVMWDPEPAEDAVHCVCLIMSKEETTRVSTEVLVPTIPCQENYVHLHNCVTKESPLYIGHLTDNDLVSTNANPNQYKIPEVHLEDDSRRKSNIQETQQMRSSCERKSEYFERATFRQLLHHNYFNYYLLDPMHYRLSRGASLNIKDGGIHHAAHGLGFNSVTLAFEPVIGPNTVISPE